MACWEVFSGWFSRRKRLTFAVATTVYDIDSPGTVSINLPTLTLSTGLGKGRERLTASAGTPGSRKAAAARC